MGKIVKKILLAKFTEYILDRFFISEYECKEGQLSTNMCIKFEVNTLKKTAELCHFECHKATFHAILGNFGIFIFPGFSDLGHSKCSMLFFAFLKTDLKLCVAPPKPEMLSSTFRLSTSDDFDTSDHQRDRRILRSIQDTSHAVSSGLHQFGMAALPGNASGESTISDLWSDL